MNYTVDTPRSLKNCCVDYFCDKIDAICQTQTSIEGQVCRVLSTNDEFYLPRNIAEVLVVALSSKRKIEDWMLMLFDSKITGLRNVRLTNVSKLTLTGLRILQSHDILHLEVTGLSHVTVNDLVGCLGYWTLQNLQTLNVANSTFVDNAEDCIMESLSKLRNLRTLNVSNTEFNDQGLEIVAENLTKLENLDISGTKVSVITPLKKCANRLKSLNMANVQTTSTTEDVDVICDLHHLRHLDLSDDTGERPFTSEQLCQKRVEELLERPSCLPFLSSLEISGLESILTDDFRNFLVQHPQITFLGLAHTDACSDEMFTDLEHDLYNPNLVVQVTGSENESQILEALRRYPNRALLFLNAIYLLIQLTEGCEDARVDIISLILPGLEAHPKLSDFQNDALGCLYQLCQGELCQKIHPYWLKRIVELTVTAMENFPTESPLNNNALLILCNDRILQDVTFDAYRCVRVMMDALCEFDNESIKRMSASISCVVTQKMSPEDRSRIGTQTRYIIKLLSIVESKMEEGVTDEMMRLTLSALWGLTDESPETCRVFLNEDGLELYLKVLDKFKSRSAIEKKVLGLILNIAVVKKLRQALMTENFLTVVGSLLQSSETEVSYFAAGITAHLASDGERAWTVPTISRAEMLSKIESAVKSWKNDVEEFATYDSFNGFYPLLLCFESKEVQLWAVWAVHHVCSTNTKKYRPVLIKEGGVKIISDLLSNQQTSKSVKEKCRQILDLVRDWGMSRNVDESSR